MIGYFVPHDKIAPFKPDVPDGVRAADTTFETIVELIGNTRTEAGLRVKAKLDTRKYSTGVEITNAEMNKLALRPHTFHGDWNYELQPRDLTR